MLQIYIVSLKRDKEKRQIIQEKLHSLGLDFVFVDAVDGKLLPESQLNGLKFSEKIQQRKFTPAPGEIGCGLSHLKAYELFISSFNNWLCVLEDDAILDERFASFIQNFDEKKLLHYKDSLFILGGQNGLQSRRLISKSIFSYVYAANQLFRRVINSERHVYRTCCYLVNRDVASNFLKLSKQYFFLADDWVFLQKHGAFKDIYISDFVDHPLDLTKSAIEQERLALKLGSEVREPSFIMKLKYYLKVVLARLRSFSI